MASSHSREESKASKVTSLRGHTVIQGNGNGKSIPLGSQDILLTSDLVDCIAVLIVSQENCYMIHSDTNDAKGIGLISLEQGIKKLGLDTENPCTVGLIGGMSELTLEHKKRLLQTLLPRARFDVIIPKADSAYLLGIGVMAESKAKIKVALKVEDLTIEEQPSPTPTSTSSISSRRR